MATRTRTSQEVSSSKRHFHWTNKVSNQEDDVPTTLKSSSSTSELNSFSMTSDQHHKKDEKKQESIPTTKQKQHAGKPSQQTMAAIRRKLVQVAKVRTLINALNRNRSSFQHGLGPRVVGTLFGNRQGQVHFAFQKDPNSQPAFLIELATPISGLVKEMASGLVRIALECDKEDEKKTPNLLEQPIWRTSCNGKRHGFATRRECEPRDWKILKAVEPISTGAGVLPAAENGDEIMYMRAKFERIVGSKDSEAFYMMNPDSNGAPELGIYLLRV